MVKVRFFQDGSWMDQPQDPIIHVKANEIKEVSKNLAYVVCMANRGELIEDVEPKKSGPEWVDPPTADEVHLEHLGLKPLIVKKLLEAEITEVVQLLAMTRGDILALDGFGQGKLDDIIKALGEMGFNLKEG